MSRLVPLRISIALLWIGSASSGCGSDLPAEPDRADDADARPVARVRIAPSQARLLFLEDEVQLHARAVDADGFTISGATFTWSTSDSSVVTLSGVGLAVAAGKGSTTITATTQGVSGSATVTVDPGIALQNECMTCHWERAPGEHFAWGFAFETCLACHDTAEHGYSGVRDGHETASGGFGLVGTHADLDCGSCHVSGTIELQFAPTSQNDCIACHQADYDRQHAATGFPTGCVKCHGTATWTGAALDHTAFPLSGPHLALDCASCHDPTTGAPRFAPTDPADCFACHEADYDRQHAGSGFPTTCLSCHTGVSWPGATLDHADWANGLSLARAHESLPCTSCHDPVTWAPRFTPVDQNDCIACHQADYDVQHAGSAFPTTCLSCHTSAAWPGATIDHAAWASGFGLAGAHEPLPCSSCHDPVTWAPRFTPADQNDCIACHRADYDREHGAMGYPTVCSTCHSVATWQASFDHDVQFFPIFSKGAHRGEWDTCATCHVVPTDFSTFTCFNCHRHNRDDMDAEHQGKSGYAYDSRQCYSCHPDGRKP